MYQLRRQFTYCLAALQSEHCQWPRLQVAAVRKRRDDARAVSKAFQNYVTSKAQQQYLEDLQPIAFCSRIQPQQQKELSTQEAVLCRSCG